MTINRLSHHLRGDTLANSWMDGRMERENDTDRKTEREKECARERADVLYAHYAQIFRVRPGAYSSQTSQEDSRGVNDCLCVTFASKC